MRCWSLLLSLSILSGTLEAGRESQRPRDLTELSLEELMEMEVTSVSRREQKVSEAAVAVHVITQEDIRRSGATSIPELLRMVPGLQVARINSGSWAITSRGFNGRFANKMLVLMDGRSVYTPLFSGVFWEVQDTLLEDIERIEVIRGPGATLWGANAVNGVINIITRHSRDTHGGLLSMGAGNEERGFGGFRYGDRLGDRGHYRVYSRGFNRDSMRDLAGNNARDDWWLARGGVRVDWSPTESDSLTLQGEIYSGDVGETFVIAALVPPFVNRVVDDADVSGGHIQGRWSRTISTTSSAVLQFYYDRTQRDDAVHREDRDTADFDFQHLFRPHARHDVLWGAGYRYTGDDIDSSFLVSFDPAKRGDHLFSAFVQDDVLLIQDRFRVTLGSKFERNDYTGFEIQPNVRLLWTPDARQSIWAAVSRAVRTPSRFEHDARVNLFASPGQALPVLLSIFGDEGFRSEQLVAWETGYRAQMSPTFSLDVSGFVNEYERLRTFEPREPFFEPSPQPHVVAPLDPRNLLSGQTWGVEAAFSWRAQPWWRVSGAYSWFRAQLKLDPGSGDFLSESAEGSSPEHQFHLRSYLDLPGGFKFDSALYLVDELEIPMVPGYARVDTRLAWNWSNRLDFSLVIQNLTDARHAETAPALLANPSQIERSIFGKVTWRFQ